MHHLINPQNCPCDGVQVYLKGLNRDGFAMARGEKWGAGRGQTHVLESFQSLGQQRNTKMLSNYQQLHFVSKLITRKLRIDSY